MANELHAVAALVQCAGGRDVNMVPCNCVWSKLGSPACDALPDPSTAIAGIEPLRDLARSAMAAMRRNAGWYTHAADAVSWAYAADQQESYSACRFWAGTVPRSQLRLPNGHWGSAVPSKGTIVMGC